MAAAHGGDPVCVDRDRVLGLVMFAVSGAILCFLVPARVRRLRHGGRRAPRLRALAGTLTVLAFFVVGSLLVVLPRAQRTLTVTAMWVTHTTRGAHQHVRDAEGNVWDPSNEAVWRSLHVGGTFRCRVLPAFSNLESCRAVPPGRS